jgi:hypothetical protein
MTWKFIYTYWERWKRAWTHPRCIGLVQWLAFDCVPHSRDTLGPLARESPCILNDTTAFFVNNALLNCDSVLSHCMCKMNGRIFHEIWYFRFLQKSAKEMKVWLKSDKNNGYFIWTHVKYFIWTHIKYFIWTHVKYFIWTHVKYFIWTHVKYFIWTHAH